MQNKANFETGECVLTGVQDLTFDHGRDSKFPLVGGHARLDCEKCHPRRTTETPMQVRLFDVGKSCQDCHADPHAGQMSSPCGTCHAETGWTGNSLVFSHGQYISFALDKLHSAVTCAACHSQQEKQTHAKSHEKRKY